MIIALINLASELSPSNVEPLSIESLAGQLEHTFKSDISVYLFDQQRTTLSEIMNKVVQIKPNIIGLSLPRGTINEAKIFVSQFELYLKSDYLLVLGGSIPTIRPDIVLELFPNSITVQGFGEQTIVELVHYYNKKIELTEVSNLVYKMKGQSINTKSTINNLEDIAIPKRYFAHQVYNSGGIINAETSRNCSFASSKSACSFCVRDPRFIGKNREVYLKGNVERAISDLKNIVSLGIREINYVDEEFLGNRLEFAKEFAMRIIQENIKVNFLFSCRIDSIYAAKDNSCLNHSREETLSLLSLAGLKRIFIGLESASNSQLRRYHKGYKSSDIMPALEVLYKLNIETEIGFILFDPLVSIEELEENINFLLETKLWKFTSSIFNVLRVSDSTYYFKLVKNVEKLNNVSLLGRFDKNTLEYDCKFLHKEVDDIYNIMTTWTAKTSKLRYALKSIVRGKLEAKGVDLKLDKVRSIVENFKELEISLLQDLLRCDNPNKVLTSYLSQLSILKKEIQSMINQKIIIDNLNIIRKNL